MGYNAVAVSSTDLSAGKAFFQSTSNEGFPWISSNIFDSNGTLFFDPYVIKKIGLFSIALLGITGKGPRELPELTIGDWQTALAQYVQELKDKSDFILLLSNLPTRHNDKIVEQFPEIGLIFTADKRRGNVPPYLSGTTLITQSSNRGRYFGQLIVNLIAGGQWKNSQTLSSKQIAMKIAGLDLQIDRLKSTMNNSEATLRPKQDRRLQSLLQQKAATIKKMDQARLLQEEDNGSLFNTYSYKSRKVTPASTTGAVPTIVGEIRSNINNHNQSRKQRALSAEESRLLQMEEIIGYTSCMKCHEDQTSFWKSTGHAHAFQTLETKGQSYNTDCLPCHVTSGRVNPQSHESEKSLLLSLQKERQIIGCEVCHGPARSHVSSPESILPTRRPDESICLPCHSSEMDNSFNYNDQLLNIACPAE